MEIIGVIAVIVAVLVIDMVKQRLRKHVAAPVAQPRRKPQEASSPTPPPVPTPVAGKTRRAPAQPLPEEGVRVTRPSVITDDVPVAGGQDTAEPDWRNAVIYSEILKTKF